MPVKKLIAMVFATLLIAAFGYSVWGQQKEKPLTTKQAMGPG